MKKLFKLMLLVIIIASVNGCDDPTEQKEIQMASDEEMADFGKKSNTLAEDVKARKPLFLNRDRYRDCYCDSVTVDSVRYIFLRSEESEWLDMRKISIQTGQPLSIIYLFYDPDTEAYEGEKLSKKECADFSEAMTLYSN